MAVTITHSTPADGTFSATGAAAWDASHSVSGLGTMAEQNSNNVNITGGSITGVTGVLTGLTVNSTPTSGGAAGQIMFDTGSVLQESSNLVWDNTAKRLTLTGYSLTGTSALSQLDLSGTWNTSGTPTAIKLNVTNTASNAASLLMDLQVGGVSRTNIRANIGTQTWNLYGTDGVTVAGRIEYSTPGAAPGLIFYTDLGTANRINFAYRATNTIFAFGWGSVTGNAQLGVTSTGNTIVPNFAAFSWNSTDLNTANTPDLYLTRRGAANLRFGAADAAAPVAQTLSVQSVVAGTSNTAGANLTITGSQGTGTGAGGSIIFQVAPAGSSGTAQNALSTALTINSLTQSLFSDGSVSGPSISFSSASNTGIYYFSSGFHFAAGGANIFGVRTEVRVNGSYAFGFTSGTTTATVNDVLLTRRGAANLRFGAADAAAPVAQTLSVQSVVAGTSNTAGANLTITGSQGTGTGAGGSIIFQVAPAGSSGTAQNALATLLSLNADQTISYAYTVNSGGLLISSSSALGASSGGSINIYTTLLPNAADQKLGQFLFGSTSGGTLNSASVTAYSDAAWVAGGSSRPTYITFQTTESGASARSERLRITATGLLAFGGGGTSSFPALKRSTTTLQVRLADDSAYAPVEASTVRTATAYTVATLPAAGTAGRKAYVTDALAPTFLGALTGGGTVVTPVFDNGTAWVAG